MMKLSDRGNDASLVASAAGFCCRLVGRSFYKHKPSCRGSALFELLLAVMIFGLAALALSRSLNQVGLLAIETKRAARIQSKAHSLLFEYGFGSELVEGEVELPQEDTGINYSLVVEAVEMENQEGLVLPDLFKIKVDVDWQEAGQQQHFTAETLRYAPLYR